MQVGKPMGKFGDSWRVRKHVRLGKAMARATIAQVHMLQQQQACIPGAASAATSQAVQTLAHRGWRPTPQVGMGKVVFVLMGAFTSILLGIGIFLGGIEGVQGWSSSVRFQPPVERCERVSRPVRLLLQRLGHWEWRPHEWRPEVKQS